MHRDSQICSLNDVAVFRAKLHVDLLKRLALCHVKIHVRRIANLRQGSEFNVASRAQSRELVGKELEGRAALPGKDPIPCIDRRLLAGRYQLVLVAAAAQNCDIAVRHLKIGRSGREEQCPSTHQRKQHDGKRCTSSSQMRNSEEVSQPFAKGAARSGRANDCTDKRGGRRRDDGRKHCHGVGNGAIFGRHQGVWRRGTNRLDFGVHIAQHARQHGLRQFFRRNPFFEEGLKVPFALRVKIRRAQCH